MPYHTPAKKKRKLPPMKKNKSKKNKLTTKQKTKLQTHSKHHSPAHIREMKQLMVKGESFADAHASAMEEVGK